MTKDEIIDIIKQNADILTPETYQRALKDVDILTENDKQRIVGYLTMARQALDVHERLIKTETQLYKEAGDELKVIRQEWLSAEKAVLKKAESGQSAEESQEADKLISNF